MNGFYNWAPFLRGCIRKVVIPSRMNGFYNIVHDTVIVIDKLSYRPE